MLHCSISGIGGLTVSTGIYLLARYVTNPEGVAFLTRSPERMADATVDALLIPVFATVGLLGGMFAEQYRRRRNNLF